MRSRDGGGGGGGSFSVSCLTFIACLLLAPEPAGSRCSTFVYEGPPHGILNAGSIAYFNHYGVPPEQDGDMDFLIDKFEYALAEHFKPRLHCYEDDLSCTGTPDDPMPVVLFQVSPIDCNAYDFSPIHSPCLGLDEDKIYLAITYTMLWPEDTGVGRHDYSYLSHDDCMDRFAMGSALHCAPLTVGSIPPCISTCGADPLCYAVCLSVPNIPVFMVCFNGNMILAAGESGGFWHCRCNEEFLADESFFDGIAIGLGYLELVDYERTYHSLWRGGHFGDNNYFRVFVAADRDDRQLWSILGIQNATGTRVTSSDPPICADLYLSYGKKHQYLIMEDAFESSETPGKFCLWEDPYSGDWFKDSNDIINWAIGPCGECFYRDRMVAIEPRLTHPGSPDGYNEVGSFYSDIWLNAPGEMPLHPRQRIEEMDHLLNDEIFHSDEKAWDCGYDDECGDHYFCGSGYRYPPDENYCCRHPYYTWGEEWCDRVQQAQTASGVGSQWLKSAKSSGFDHDGASCFPLGVPGVDYIPDGPEDCPAHAIVDNCPLVNNWPYDDYDGDTIGDLCDISPVDYNPYQEDVDGDGYGDVTDMCPHSDRYWEGDDADGDTLMDECDLCPLETYVMDRRGTTTRGWLAAPQRYRDDKFLAGNEANNFDGDDFGNRCDICPHVYNYRFDDDGDGDGYGDMCDLCPDQNADDISLPDFEFVYGGRDPCDVFTDPDCFYDIRRLDSKDELPGENALKRIHDFDGDGVGNLCDNCTYAANTNQHNCNEDWERGTRWPSFEGQFRAEEDLDGDACDPEPCTKAVHGTWNLMEIHDNYDPFDIEYYCRPGMGDLPNEAYAFAEIPLEHYGYDLGAGENDTPRYTDTDHLLRRHVINGYCDCTESPGQCEGVMHCGEFGYLRTDEFGHGWYHLSRIAETDVPESDPDWPWIPPTGESPFTTSRSDFGHNYVRAFRGNDGTKNCFDDPIAGCTWMDISYIRDNRKSVYWDFIKDLGRGPGHYVRLFFKPDDDRFTDAFWPGYIHKNNYYSEDVYTLQMPCAFYWRPPPERPGGTGPGRYSPFESPGDPGPGAYLKDKVLIESYPCWLEAALVGQWRYEVVKPASATQGLMIMQFDRNKKDLTGFYRSLFDSPEDIIDTEGFAAARMMPEMPPHAWSDGAAPAPEDLHEPGTLWVFGGRDLASYRNDLWRGEPVFIQDGETAYHWTRTTFETPGAPGGAAPEAAPAGRTGAALLADPDRNRLVLWGGEGEAGPLDDLWVLDISTMTWTKIAKGKRPPALSQFLAAQAGGAGYIFGGFDSSGAFSDRIYKMDLETLGAVEIQAGGNVPPPLTGASLSADPSGKILYLFGGFDGERWHNWLYALDLVVGRWHMVIGDCESGTCPYLSSSPVLFGNFYEPSFIAFAGRGESPGVLAYVEDFFSLDPATGAWEGASAVRGDSARVGDCDGDGTIETGYGALCGAAAGWWNLPGRMTCDTATSSLLCSQEALMAPAIYEMHRWGVEDIEASENYLFTTKGSSLVAYDMTLPASPRQVLDLRLRQKTGDVEIDEGLMAVAAGKKIVILDVSDPSAASILGQAQVCGNVTAIEFYGGSIFYLTRGGIGELDVSDPSLPFTARFAALRRHWDGSWSIDPGGGGCCEGWWSFLSFARPFDVGGGRAFIGAGNDLLVIKVTQDSFEVEGKLALSSWIDDLKYDRGLVYLDLFGGQKITVVARGGEPPSVAGTHDLWDWVKGLPSGGGKVYRLHWNKIQTAVVR